MVVRAMCRQFQLPIEIVPQETIRADDGLALSSRNGYLSADQRAEAPQLYATLRRVQADLRSGNHDAAALEREATATLDGRGWKVDYISVRRQRDLLPPSREEVEGGEPLVALAAAKLGATRLIDNLEL